MMKIQQQLLERIQNDARSNIKQWSMRELASQKLRPPSQPPGSVLPVQQSHHHHADPNVSTELLQCTVQRLAVQHESLRAWKQELIDTLARHERQSSTVFTTSSSPTNHNHHHHNVHQLYKSVIQRIDTLQYIHYDTYRIGQDILHHPRRILDRQTVPARHVIHHTFLEIRARHAKTIETMVHLVSDLWRRHNYDGNDDDNSCHHHYSDHEVVAEQFLRRRTGIQLLCDHHVALHQGKAHGAIAAPARLVEHVLADAIQEAKHLVDAHLPVVPNVDVIQVAGIDGNDPHCSSSSSSSHEANNREIMCTMVQPWVHHAIVELLKNAMLSTVRQMQYMATTTNHRPATGDSGNTVSTTATTTPAPVYIKCHDNEHSVVIDIVDAGTGILDDVLDDDPANVRGNKPTAIQRAFMLGHTTSSTHRYDRLNEQQSYASVQIPPLSSLGVGLPISQYLMEHFHGTLQLWNNSCNQHGDGTGTATTTGCTARIELMKDDTILERSIPL